MLPMITLTNGLKSGADLSRDEIEDAVARLVSADVDDPAKADFLRALREKGETAAEIADFARALLDRAVNPMVDAAELPGPLLDVCGTGGDRLEFFNVSTTSMFVLAAGGAVVVKHGNRAITSQCGGADVLEALGIKIETSIEQLNRNLETVGLGFLFAPAYHPAFKAIVPVRKMLAAQGIPTIFNILGPLLNPARPPYQLIGIFSRTLLEKYAQALRVLGRARAWAVHGDGADELTLTGPSDVREVTPEGIRAMIIAPDELGLSIAPRDDLRGGDKARNAQILTAILDGTERGPKRDIVLLNAAAGFVITGLASDLRAGIALAKEQIESGRALARLRALQRAC